ncbi:hypothetical protein RUND412_008666 [Rhizina undulata]
MVELGNRKQIRVTLFDANHCPGAVMFLIEGDGKAILYTGDIRAEAWWVQYLSRHPILIPYTTGIKRLDKIYLDTTFACRKRFNQEFPSKREGIRELIEKINMYPKDTLFHLNAWTFGYEDVWVALAAAFKTQIHLSKYHFLLFKSICDPEKSIQGPYLSGFKFGNSSVGGCTTTNPEVRFHSCERRLGCSGLEGKKVVWITPIITRVGDFDILEEGCGSGDLENQDDLSLHGELLQQLLQVLGLNVSPEVKELLVLASNSRKQGLPLKLESGEETKNIDLEGLASNLSKAASSKRNLVSQSQLPLDHIDGDEEDYIKADNGKWLSTNITFPYSRHSSLSELRDFVGIFRPKDIYPCVVDDRYWGEEKSMESLFGDLCGGMEFTHDKEMQKKFEEKERLETEWEMRIRHEEMQSQIRMETQENTLIYNLYGQQWNEHKEKHDSRTSNSLAISSVPGVVTPRTNIESDREKTPTHRCRIPISVVASSTAGNTPTSSPVRASKTITPRKPKIEYNGEKAQPARPLHIHDVPSARKTPASSPIPASELTPRKLKFEESDGEKTSIQRGRISILDASSTASNVTTPSPILQSKDRHSSPPQAPQPFSPPTSNFKSSLELLKPSKRPLYPTPIPHPKKLRSSPQAPQTPAETPKAHSIHPSGSPSCSANSSRDLKILTKEIGAMLAPLPSSPLGELDEELVLQAQEAALGLNGKSWWDIELKSTNKWKYVEEMEL